MPELRITSSDADAVKALARLEGQLNKVRAELHQTQEKARAAGAGMTEGMAKAGGETEKTGRKIKDAGESAKQAFGRSAVQAVQSYLTSIVSVSAAIGIMKKALQEYHEEQRRGAEGLKAGAAPQMMLAQLADTPEQLRSMMAEVRKSRAEAGMTAAEASRLQFTLQSAGIPEMRSFFAGFRGTAGAEPGELATAAWTIREAFGGGETGAIENIVSKLLAGSAATKTSITPLAQAAAGWAKPGAAIGVTDEEALAATAVLTNALRSPEEAKTQLQALSQTMRKKGVTGAGILGGVPELQRQIDQVLAAVPAGEEPEEALVKFFGRIEGLKAFEAIQQNQDAIRATMTAVSAADSPELAMRRRNLFQQVPELAAVRGADVAAEQRAIAEEQAFGVRALTIEETRQMGRARLIRQGAGFGTRFGLGAAMELESRLPGASRESVQAYAGMRQLGGPEELLARGLAGFVTPGANLVAPGQATTAEDIKRVLERMAAFQERETNRRRNPTLGRPDEDR